MEKNFRKFKLFGELGNVLKFLLGIGYEFKC